MSTAERMATAIDALLRLDGDDRERVVVIVRKLANARVATPPAPGIRGPKSRIWPAIAKHHADGKSNAEIAELLGLSLQQVQDSVRNQRKRGLVAGKASK